MRIIKSHVIYCLASIQSLRSPLAGSVSHKPSGRLTLLPVRPTFSIPTTEHLQS